MFSCKRTNKEKLKKQRSKAIAGGFVLEESDVTYRAPKGFYGDFGVAERNVQGKATMHEDNEDEVEEAGSSGSSTEKVVIKKPKTGFINNELFPPDDEELSDTTLKNNISVALAQIGEEDIEVNQLVDHDVTNRDVTNCDGTTPDKMNLFNRDRKVLFHTSDDEYRVDKTPGIIDERWRIKCNSYPVDNRGFGQHRDVLNQMQSRDTRDQNLIQILHDVIDPEENKDDDDVDDYDDDVDDYDDDDYEDDDNGEETSDGNGTNGDIKGSSGSSNGCSDTSSYTNAMDKMPKDDTASAASPYDLSLSLSIEDGDKPQEKLNIDNQTQKHDVNRGKMKVSQGDVNGETDRGDGVQLEAQQTVGQRSVGEEKHDLNGPDEDSWIPKQDIDKNQIPETPNEEKRDINSDGPQTSNEEKHDVNSDGPQTPNEEKHDINSDGTQTPNEGKRDINSDGVQLEAKQSVGEEKRDLNGSDTNPEPQEGENLDTINVNHNTENKLGIIIEITPQQQVMSIDDSVQSEIVDLSGKLIIDANTGNAYNIDEIDVSQFTEMYVVSCHDDPLQNYKKITLQLLDDEIKKEGDEQPVLQEIQVHQMTVTTNENKQHTVMNPDKTEGKHDAVVTEAKQNGDEKTEGKCDAVVTEANKDRDEKTEEKCDAVVTEAKQNGDEKTEGKRDAVVTEANKNSDEKTEGKSDVGLSDDSCSSERKYMKKTDSYNSETEDTTESSSSESKKVQRDIEIDSDVQEIQPTTDKCDVKTKRYNVT